MNLGRALFGQLNVINALILRETRTRFGAHKAGYLWALVEPSLMIATFWVVFSLGGRAAPFGMSLFGFVATGIVPFVLFSNSVSRVAESINGNKPLLFYPQVTVIDIVLARLWLEFCTYVAVFLALMGGHALVVQEIHIADPLMLILGFLFASLLGTSLGLVFCGLGQFSNVADRARGPLLRPLFWISGIFFTANALPAGMRDPLLINPVFHVIEFCRGGWYLSYEPTHASYFYTVSWIAVLALTGLSLERMVRKHIEVT